MYNVPDVNLMFLLLQKAKLELQEEEQVQANNMSHGWPPASPGTSYQQEPQQNSPHMGYMPSPNFLPPTSPAYQQRADRYPQQNTYMNHQQNVPQGLCPAVAGTKSQNGVRVVQYPEKGYFPAAVKTENFENEVGRHFKDVAIQGETPETEETREKRRGDLLPNIKMERVNREQPEEPQQFLDHILEQALERKPEAHSAPPSIPSPQPVEKEAEAEEIPERMALFDGDRKPLLINGKQCFAAAVPQKKKRNTIYAPPPPAEEDDDCLITHQVIFNQPPKQFTPQFAKVKREIFPIEEFQNQETEKLQEPEELPAAPVQRKSTGSEDVTFGSQEVVESEVQAPVEPSPVPILDLASELNIATDYAPQQRKSASPAPRILVEQNIRPNNNRVEQTAPPASRTHQQQTSFKYPVKTNFSNSSKVTNPVPQRKNEENRKRPLPPPVAGPKKIRAKVPTEVQNKEQRRPQPAVQLQAPPASYNSRDITNSSTPKSTPRYSIARETGNGNLRPKEVARKPLQVQIQRTPAPSTTQAPSSSPLDNIFSTMDTPVTAAAPGVKRSPIELECLQKQLELERKKAHANKRSPKTAKKGPKQYSMAQAAQTPQEIYRRNNGSRLYSKRSPGPQPPSPWDASPVY